MPLPGYENKVLYVWFEACIGYPPITANYAIEWKQWLHNPEHVQLYQFLGKDNVPFHSVIFPGCQMGSGDCWTMLHYVEYFNYENGKFSKSRRIGIFGNNTKATVVPGSQQMHGDIIYSKTDQRPGTPNVNGDHSSMQTIQSSWPSSGISLTEWSSLSIPPRLILVGSPTARIHPGHRSLSKPCSPKSLSYPHNIWQIWKPCNYGRGS